MAAYGLYTHIASNRFRSMLLLGGLFLLIYVLVYAGALLAEVFLDSDRSVDFFRGFSIVVVPVRRLVNDWFTRQFFPLDVVNCFIGFVAPISRERTGRRFRGRNRA